MILVYDYNLVMVSEPMVMGARLCARDGVESMGITGGWIKGCKKKRSKRFGNLELSSGSNLSCPGLTRVVCGCGCKSGLRKDCLEHVEQQRHSKNGRKARRQTSSRKSRVWCWANLPSEV